MNRTRVAFCILAMIAGASTLRADVSYQAYDPDVDDLQHNYLYVWKITPSLAEGQVLSGATLTFDNLNDWTNESNDHLYVRLLSSQNVNQALVDHAVSTWLPNLYRGWDQQGGADSLAAYGTSLMNYSDYSTAPEDVTYTFTSSQVSWLSSVIAGHGFFGIGLDPDCHYLNDGITLTLQTATVPATVPVPGALVLAGMGTALVGWTRRTLRRFSK